MSAVTALIIVVALILSVSAICSLFEATLYSTRVAALEAARGDKRQRVVAEHMLHMKRDISAPTSAILILNTVANTAGAAVAGWYAARLFGPPRVALFSAGLTLGILFLSEILPKTYGAAHWRGLWPLIVYPLLWMKRLLYPMVWLTQRFAGLFTTSDATQVMTEEEIEATVRLSAKSGELSAAEVKLIGAVFQFDDLVCRQVMLPRQQVVWLDASWTLGRCVEVVRKHQHTRYPVCAGEVEQVQGVLHIKDLLLAGDHETKTAAEVMRPPSFVAEEMHLTTLLRDMQASHQHLAFVVDEYGGVLGIVTLENALEQIVGSIQDEFDKEKPEIEKEAKGCYVLRGRLPLRQINRELNLDLYEPGIDTLGGLLMKLAGRLVEQGEKFELEGATAEVLEVDGPRVERVRLCVLPQH